MSRNQRTRQHGKVFHVRTKNNGLARSDGFDRILPAVCSQTFADKNCIGDSVPVAKFSGGIENHAIWRGVASWSWPATQRNAQFTPLELPPNFERSLRVSRCDDQKDGRKLLAPVGKSLRKNFFFTAMS